MGEYIVQYMDGDKEQLNWIKRRGKVSIQYPNEDKFLGTLNDARKKVGKGSYEWALSGEEGEGDGNARKPVSYNGSYVDGLRSGIGRMVYRDGSEYNGQWKNGKMHGQGTTSYANKDTYSGLWANGERCGHGAYVFSASGAQMVGAWQGNNMTRGKWILANSAAYCGNFSENKPQGQGVFIHANGLLQEGVFESKNGQENEDQEDDAAAASGGNRVFRGAAIGDTLSAFKNVIAPVRNVAEQKNMYNMERKDGDVGVGRDENSNGSIGGDGGANVSPENESDSPVVQDSKTVSREAELLKALFLAIDGNEDGKVDLCEMAKFLHSDAAKEYDELLMKVPTLGSEETQQVLKDIDQDGDGRLALEELMNYFFYVKLFNMCDADGSGQVTHRELFKAMTENAHEFPVSLVAGTNDRAGVSARITELDRDNDRSLSFVEFAKALVRFT